jgi:serine/threonine protein kinase
VKRVNQYVLLKTLGKGASSTVVQCLLPSATGNDNDDAYFAMKIIKRSFFKQSHSTLISEFEALKKLSHPNIIKLHEIINDPKEQNIYMIMDLIPGGTIDS